MRTSREASRIEREIGRKGRGGLFQWSLFQWHRG